MKKGFIWILAVIITISASYYQRKTGPTHPLSFKTEIGAETYKFNLTRSASTGHGSIVKIPVTGSFDAAEVVYKKYPGNFTRDTIPMQKDGEQWLASLPIQPPAGKLLYYVNLKNEDQIVYSSKEKPAIVRFKGEVPAWVLIPHVLAMFAAMLLSTVALLMAVFKKGNMRKLSIWTFSVLAVGGFIFGPLVQYFAFGQAWTGFPVGMDLTDNKTLIAGLFWLLAMVLNLKKERRWFIILASVVLLGIFSIPHSARGSEYNYDTGQVETGNELSES